MVDPPWAQRWLAPLYFWPSPTKHPSPQNIITSLYFIFLALLCVCLLDLPICQFILLWNDKTSLTGSSVEALGYKGYQGLGQYWSWRLILIHIYIDLYRYWYCHLPISYINQPTNQWNDEHLSMWSSSRLEDPVRFGNWLSTRGLPSSLEIQITHGRFPKS